MKTLNISNRTFYMKEANTLPLYIKDANEKLIEIDLDDMDETDEECTLREMLEDEGFIIDYDNNYIFRLNDVEEIGYIHEYYGSSDIINSTTDFYKINEDLYAVNPANEDNYYVWSDPNEMVKENASAVEVWHLGNDKLKKLFFGDELENIKNVVENEDDVEDPFIIIDIIELEENSPAYSFEYVGITADKELVYYYTNNCNITLADRPVGYSFTIEEMIENVEKRKKATCGDDFIDFRETPYKKDDVENVLNFMKKNK